mgnify:CR=1 FL=1
MKRKRRDWNGMIIKVCFAAFLLVYLGILCMRGYAKDVSIGAMHKEFESASFWMEWMREKTRICGDTLE